MRLAWYAGASTALAAGVITSAFYQRANFYSATVYLSQSSLCLMILVNLIFLLYGSFMYGLQRLCFGPLRPNEVEQLYEKGWFAVTETCLAMTIFREEIGASFLFMFTALITGKVWGWIGEGRIEVLEQQPPANPRLFHARLSISLVLSILYNTLLLRSTVSAVVRQARPNVTVMFLFEFAVLMVGSVHTATRYLIAVQEARITKRQTAQMLAQRRQDARDERARLLRERAEAGNDDAQGEQELPDPDNIDEMDIEVAGWEAKGQWVLILDLVADFVKLTIYTAFFVVLAMFYGLPLHIMRDLFMTARSFMKRLVALMRYRQALQDMNRYPDATAEELHREATCIICREDMTVWDPNQPRQLERSRPKKLPCGHILHFGCLKSWLERQQVCPTCRRSVAIDAPQPPAAARNRNPLVLQFGIGNAVAAGAAAPPANGAAPGGGLGHAANGDGAPAAGAPRPGNLVRARMFNVGPFRIGFANVPERAARAAQAPMANAAGAQLAVPPAAVPQPVTDVRSRITDLDQQLQREVRDLQTSMQIMQIASQELQMLNLLQMELTRLRGLQAQIARQSTTRGSATASATVPQTAAGQAPQENQNGGQAAAPAFQPPMGLPQPPQHPTQAQAIPAQGLPHMPPAMPLLPMIPQQHQFPVLPGQMPFQPFLNGAQPGILPRFNTPGVTRHSPSVNATAIPAGSPDLPEGVVLPAGWSLLPLQRMDQNAAVAGTVRSATPIVHVNGSGPTTASQAAQPAQAPASRSASTDAASRQANLSQHMAPISQGQDTPAGTAASDAAAAASTLQPAPMAAPAPVVPNWGGQNQLLRNMGARGRSPATSNGDVVSAASSRSVSGQAGPNVIPNAGDGAVEQSTEAAMGGSNDETQAEETGTSVPTESNGTVSNGHAKGKAPAASVEDADEDAGPSGS